MVLLLLILGAIYVSVVRFTLRKQPARKRRLGVTTAIVAWLGWVVLMTPYVDAVTEYTGAKFDRAVLLAAVGTLLLWGAAPWAAIRIAVRINPKHQQAASG